MTTIPKEELISELKAMGKRIAELAGSFDEDVHISIGAFREGYIRIACSMFEDDKISAMPVRRYFSTVNNRWEEDEEDAYPEVHKAPED